MKYPNVLPINYLAESSNVYQSDNQIGNYTYINSPIDYSKGQLCPYFCVCKSGSYVNKCLKINNLKEFARPPNMTSYNAIYTLITAKVMNHSLPIRAKCITIMIPKQGIRVLVQTRIKQQIHKQLIINKI